MAMIATVTTGVISVGLSSCNGIIAVSPGGGGVLLRLVFYLFPLGISGILQHPFDRPGLVHCVCLLLPDMRLLGLSILVGTTGDKHQQGNQDKDYFHGI